MRPVIPPSISFFHFPWRGEQCRSRGIPQIRRALSPGGSIAPVSHLPPPPLPGAMGPLRAQRRVWQMPGVSKANFYSHKAAKGSVGAFGVKASIRKKPSFTMKSFDLSALVHRRWIARLRLLAPLTDRRPLFFSLSHCLPSLHCLGFCLFYDVFSPPQLLIVCSKAAAAFIAILNTPTVPLHYALPSFVKLANQKKSQGEHARRRRIRRRSHRQRRAGYPFFVSFSCMCRRWRPWRRIGV